MAEIARLGDAGSHGGVIVTASEDVTVNSIGVARIGDILLCSSHGPQPIVTGSGTVFANGVGVARIGDLAACTAEIVTGSADVTAG